MCYFSAITDLRSSIGMKPYMSYTVHFVDEESKLQTRCLQTHFLPDDHTGENLVEAMQEALAGWNLKATHQVCLTTDNGTNVINAADCLDSSQLSCFGHILHLGITKALKDDHRCERALTVCHMVASAFSMSWKCRRDLTKAQVNLQLCQHSLVPDCITRWGSMVKMVLEQEDAISTVLGADSKAAHLIPPWQDLEVLTTIDQVLSPLSCLTNILSERVRDVSAILPMLQLIDTKLQTGRYHRQTAYEGHKEANQAGPQQPLH